MWHPGQIPQHTQDLGLTDQVQYYQPGQRYDSSTVFYYDLYGPNHDLIVGHLQQGYRVIFDAKNEHYVHFRFHDLFLSFLQHPGQAMIVVSGHTARSIPGVAVVAVPAWYWIMDCQHLRYFQLDQYLPRPQIQHAFLMTIEKQRPERDYLCDQLGDLLGKNLYSYRHRGVYLPNDWHEDLGGPYQRYVNTDWLDATAFTLIVETYIDESAVSGFSLTLNDRLFLCEKSYKPLACQHPFLMASTQGNLAYLRSQGFESFPELWDESYDLISDWRERMNCVANIARNFDVRQLENPRVREKCLHNSARFFDQDLVNQMTHDTVRRPILDWIHSTQ